MMLAPIALFAYRRPDHLRQTVESLRRNAEAPDSELFVFCDGPGRMTDLPAVQEVRRIARSIDGFSQVTVVERDRNLGLANSIIDGVTRLCADRGRVIVVEDDLLLSPYFLRFMNDGLERYRDDDRVVSVHGYVYPVAESLPPTFFLRGADCWGWATWSRAWRLFQSDGMSLLRELRACGLVERFDFDGSYPFSKMLAQQANGRNQSWAIRWYASAFLANRLTLYPGRSLVQNTGLDGSGTHCTSDLQFAGDILLEPLPVESQEAVEDETARAAFVRFLRTTQPSRVRRVIQSLGLAAWGAPLKGPPRA